MSGIDDRTAVMTRLLCLGLVLVAIGACARPSNTDSTSLDARSPEGADAAMISTVDAGVRLTRQAIDVRFPAQACIDPVAARCLPALAEDDVISWLEDGDSALSNLIEAFHREPPRPCGF
jgi:hypothetical protein